MTLQFYKNEHQRLLDTLSRTDPRDEDAYLAVLHCLDNLNDVSIRCIDVAERIKYYEQDERADAENEKIVELPVKPEPANEHPVEDPFPEPEPEAEKPKPEPAISTKEEKPLTLAEVKAAFTAAAKSGVKVAEIINDTGYAKLSEIPDYLYPALMRSLERKKAGEE